MIDIAQTFYSLRHNAKFTGDEVNMFSLETIARTYIGTMPTQTEMDAEWIILDAANIDAQASAARKTARNLALDSLVYDFGDGRIIQTRPKDELNIRGAISIMTDNNITSIGWVMADNVKHPVTLTELQTALSAGRLAALTVWDNYIP